MIELVFTACLILSPKQCETRTLSYEDLSMFTCQMGGQAMLAQWVTQNPKWRITRWRCGIAGQRGSFA